MTKTKTKTKKPTTPTPRLISTKGLVEGYDGKPVTDEPKVPVSQIMDLCTWVSGQAGVPDVVRSKAKQILEVSCEPLTVRVALCRALDHVPPGTKLTISDKIERAELMERVFWAEDLVELTDAERERVRKLVNDLYVQPSVVRAIFKVLDG